MDKQDNDIVNNQDNDKEHKELTEDEKIDRIVAEFSEALEELEKDRAEFGALYLSLSLEDRIKLMIERSDRTEKIAKKLKMKMKPIKLDKKK